jgi:hypothetical protein
MAGVQNVTKQACAVWFSAANRQVAWVRRIAVIHNPNMHNPKSLSWWPKGVTFFIWLLLGLSVAYWWLLAQGKGAVPQMAPVSLAPAPEPSVDQVARALSGPNGGASAAVRAAPEVAADARFSLVGLVAQGHGKGVALLGVDGQAAKPFQIGALVKDPYYLVQVLRQSVLLRTKEQASGGLEIKLNPPPAPSSGGSSLALLQPAALPSTVGALNAQPSPASKSEVSVTGAEEAQAPAIPRPTFGQALNAAGSKGAESAVRAGLSEMYRSAGGIAPPLPVGSGAR